MLNIVYLLVGIVVGVVPTWLILKGKASLQSFDPRVSELDKQNAGLQAQLNGKSVV